MRGFEPIYGAKQAVWDTPYEDNHLDLCPLLAKNAGLEKSVITFTVGLTGKYHAKTAILFSSSWLFTAHYAFGVEPLTICTPLCVLSFSQIFLCELRS